MPSIAPARRIITSHGPRTSAEEPEVILHDSSVELEPIANADNPSGPGAYATAIWSNPHPAHNSYSLDLEKEDAAKEAREKLIIPGGGANVRMSEVGPNEYVAMHRTPTIDYNIIVGGSVSLIVPDGKGGTKETLAKVGDVVIQRGTLHAWRAGPEGARWACVLISTDPVKDEEGKVLEDVDL